MNLKKIAARHINIIDITNKKKLLKPKLIKSKALPKLKKMVGRALKMAK